MPACFTRLRLAGFKSFADPVVIEILPGLTGIVGPNGCGKSNVVEALRFTMGESSPKSMRSGEMEEVIFAGTVARPARNLAEVTLTLEAGEAKLPPPFHEAAELAISRSVERGRGSSFRINGREVRARDVQTLLADLGSGARASTIMGQGRILALIAAKPEERRALLEEAAGITGLHARRHEAELRLAAAEANLARAEELKAELEAGLAGLRRQARQASRYRNLGGAIRAAEAELLAIERARALAARAATESALAAARLALADAATAAETAGARAAEAAAGLPEGREAEAASRTALERARLASEQIAAEEGRARAALAAATERLAELDRDLAHGETLAADAAAAEARLAAEADEITLALRRHPGEAERAGARAAALASEAEACEAAADAAADTCARHLARASALDQERARLAQRRARLTEDERRLAAEQAEAATAAIDAERLAAAVREEEAAEAALRHAHSERERLETQRQNAAAAEGEARERLAAAETERARIAAEAEALAAVLAPGGEAASLGPALADTLAVPDGLEAALAACLGEALEAPHMRWRALPLVAPQTPLPRSATPLDAVMPTPSGLARALSCTGLIDSPAEAEHLQPSLAPGQALVSRDGGLWRWDGYSVRPGTPSAAAVRMAARNRLGALRAQLGAAEAAAREIKAAHERLAGHARELSAATAKAITAHREAESRSQMLRRAGDALRREAATATARGTALGLHAERIAAERRDLDAALAHLEAECAGLADPGAARTSLEAARAELAAARAREAAARSEQAAIAERVAALSAREATIRQEQASWAERREAAAERAAELAGRRSALLAEQAVLAALPADLARRASAAIEALEAAEQAHRQAARLLAETDQNAVAAERALRAAERSLAAAREQVLLDAAGLREAEAALAAVGLRVRERLGADAVLPEAPAGADGEAAARQRLERLLRERDAMGPVNLRAELEARELEERIAGIVREGEELASAIAKLRGSVGHLNREGRARLAAIFTEVDRNFQALFQRMFGGGRAHLALVGSEDPLAAGLEIYAQPPGKKQAQLSLLSGGEQALVVLSLVFAVFRCNPAPIAVLDEVDSPLDDINVGRFSSLIEDVVRECGTRMLVITHHPLTMARMDRLYGVTMQERGVSRLLSVDLARATEMADPPRMAAE